VVSMRRSKGQGLADQQILGTGDFVERMPKESSAQMRSWRNRIEGGKSVEERIKRICEMRQVNRKELQMGSRRGTLSQVRSEIAEELVGGLRMPLAEVARALGVSTSAISKLLRRKHQPPLDAIQLSQHRSPSTFQEPHLILIMFEEGGLVNALYHDVV
jgi:putative transposase